LSGLHIGSNLAIEFYAIYREITGRSGRKNWSIIYNWGFW